MTVSPTVGPLVQTFFTEHLLSQRRASPQTVSAYRDTFRLLFHFILDRTTTKPSALSLEDLDAPTILAFLDHLEKQRNNTTRTRNARLGAIHSFFRYVALREPNSLALVTRVLAIPSKKVTRKLVGYLTREEMDAILVATDTTHWTGRRDHELLSTMYNTGARVSEITAVRLSDLNLGASNSVQLHGKARKERIVPLWSRTARTLRLWLREIPGRPDAYVFPNARGGRLTRQGVSYILDQTVQRALVACPALKSKRVSPHIVRHSMAMHMLQAGVDETVIALWLGHEKVETTRMYVQADLAMKEQALRKLAPPGHVPSRFKPDDALLSFLTSL